MGHLRKYLAWILAALCAFLPATALGVENHHTQITTTLPRAHMITVVCGEGGAVRVGETVYTGAQSFTVERLATFRLEAVPEAGYRLSQVMAQPSQSVSLSGNTITIDHVYEDKTLTLSFVYEQAIPTPTANPTPTASPTPTTSPTPTASPTPTTSTGANEDDESHEETAESSTTSTPVFDLPDVMPQGNVLYDHYLGTGYGLSELGIVYDEAYGLDEYELLAMLYDEDTAEENLLLVIAQPDQDGTYAQRSLMLSGMQLARLWQEKKIQWIELRAGDASAMLCIEELLSGDAAKLIAWTLQEPEAARPNDVKVLARAELTAYELSAVQIEVRITPVEADGYRIGVYAWYNGQQTALSDLIPSLTIGLHAGEQADEAARVKYAAAHGLSATDASGATAILAGTLQEIPRSESEEHAGQSEYFHVSLESGTNAVVLYDPDRPPDSYRRWVLCAGWAGDAAYRLVELEITP